MKIEVIDEGGEFVGGEAIGLGVGDLDSGDVVTAFDDATEHSGGDEQYAAGAKNQ